MNKKIVFACDYDGTYRYNTEPRPVDADIEAVRRFRAEGNVFGIVAERDVFEMMAIIGVLRSEYDFIVCSGGASAIVKTSDASAGKSLTSVGVESELPVQLYCHGLNPYIVYDAVGIAETAGATGVTIDTPGFRGGVCMAEDYARTYSPAKGVGCNVHFWYGGQFFQKPVNRDALMFVFPISRCSVNFRCVSAAESTAKLILERYNGKVEIHPRGRGFDLTVKGMDKVYGIERVLEYLRLPADCVWSYGDGNGDIGMLRKYNGIAVSGSYADSTGEIPRTANCVKNALELIK